MAVINNVDLRNELIRLLTLSNIIQREIRIIGLNKSHINKIVPEEYASIYSSELKKSVMFADSLVNSIYESSVISLFSVFEKIVFAKYRTTYGELRKVVNVHSVKPLDFYNSREKFIFDSIDNLAGILYLIDGKISVEQREQINIVKSQRNYFAHGKRDVAAPTKTLSLEEIAKILDDIILEIEK